MSKGNSMVPLNLLVDHSEHLAASSLFFSAAYPLYFHMSSDVKMKNQVSCRSHFVSVVTRLNVPFYF